MSEKINEKWEEVLNFARQHATKQGMKTGIAWLRDSFNEYLNLSDSTPGYGMGGQPGCMHNREVLAGKIVLALGPFVGDSQELDEDKIARLKESLKGIVEGNGRIITMEEKYNCSRCALRNKGMCEKPDGDECPN